MASSVSVQNTPHLFENPQSTKAKKKADSQDSLEKVDFKEFLNNQLKKPQHLDRFINSLTLESTTATKQTVKKTQAPQTKQTGIQDIEQAQDTFDVKKDGKDFIFEQKSLFSFMNNEFLKDQNKSSSGQNEKDVNVKNPLEDLLNDPLIQVSAKTKPTQEDFSAIKVKVKEKDDFLTNGLSRNSFFEQEVKKKPEQKPNSTDTMDFTQDNNSHQDLFFKEALKEKVQERKSLQLQENIPSNDFSRETSGLFIKESINPFQILQKDVLKPSQLSTSSTDLEGVEVSSLSLKGAKEKKFEAVLKKDLSEHIAMLKKLSSQMESFNKKTSEFNLNLQPEALGAVKVKIEIEQDQVYARFLMQHEEDLKTMVLQKDAIQEIFASNDLNAQGENLSFFMNQQNNSSSQDQGSQRDQSNPHQLSSKEETIKNSFASPFQKDGSIIA
ncbi:MAG TPA: hypothetical protein VI959_04520 [Alphaproteobacteria bacterium]|nr:hypothetical protein [Alphaproteobacteria bacterium]